MIKTFRHKGLELFYRTGSRRGIQPAHASKLQRLLSKLDTAKTAQDMNVPGWRLHPLHGSLSGHWSVSVNGNWRMMFVFEGDNAILVDYQDYH